MAAITVVRPSTCNEPLRNGSEPVKVRMSEAPHDDKDPADDVGHRHRAPCSVVVGVSTAVPQHEVVAGRDGRRMKF
jgi:hypothetical protein